jgi:hypothetical protein
MPRSVSLESAVAQVTRDEVVTKSELARVGRLRSARQDPARVAEKLDPYAQLMTPRSFDAYTAFKAALDAPREGVAARDFLTGRAAAPAVPPAWYPEGYDLAAAAEVVKRAIMAIGTPAEAVAPGEVNEIVFTDADRSLLKSSTPSIFRHEETGELLRHPETGRLLMLGIGPTRNWSAELRELKARFPNVPWNAYKIEDHDYGSLAEILRTPAIDDAIETLKSSDRNPRSRDFVVTARSSSDIPVFMQEFLALHGVDITGVFAVNNPRLEEELHVEARHFNTARKKAMVMAAVIQMYGPENIKRVKFIDDVDDNLRGAMELLPKLFPHIQFSFYDVINDDGTDKFEHRLVARSTLTGELVDANNKKLSVDAIERYQSVDNYPLDPAFLPR